MQNMGIKEKFLLLFPPGCSWLLLKDIKISLHLIKFLVITAMNQKASQKTVHVFLSLFVNKNHPYIGRKIFLDDALFM